MNRLIDIHNPEELRYLWRSFSGDTAASTMVKQLLIAIAKEFGVRLPEGAYDGTWDWGRGENHKQIRQLHRHIDPDEVTVFTVFESTDKMEGRGRMTLNSIWLTDRDTVEEWTRTQDSGPGKEKGVDSGLWMVNEMPVFRTVNERDAYSNGELARKALAKLSKREIAALGIDLSKFK